MTSNAFVGVIKETKSELLYFYKCTVCKQQFVSAYLLDFLMKVKVPINISLSVSYKLLEPLKKNPSLRCMAKRQGDKIPTVK